MRLGMYAIRVMCLPCPVLLCMKTKANFSREVSTAAIVSELGLRNYRDDPIAWKKHCHCIYHVCFHEPKIHLVLYLNVLLHIFIVYIS